MAGLAMLTGGVLAGPAAAEPVSRLGIESLIGNARCTVDADCRTVAIGSRACGGPEAYLAWSVRITDEAALGRAVDRYNVRQADAVPPGGRMSTCVRLVDPGASCVKPVASDAASAVERAGSCQLRRPAGTRAGPAR